MAVEYIWIQGENGATMMAKQPQADTKGLFGDQGMTFKDALDIINPLQQIPIIGSIYRELTGDTISPGARLIGGAIYGLGVGGLISAAASSAFEETTGHDPGGSMMAMLKGEGLGDQIKTQQASRDKSTKQLASTQYLRGGADPIDPTSLPPGAQMVDVPVAAPNNSQLAALSTADAAAAATPPAAINPAAAPTDPVSVSALPPLINPAAGGSATGGPMTGGQTTGGQTMGGRTAANDPAIPALPTTPAGITGMSAGSHIPTAGSITPPGAALTAATTQTSLMPQSSGGPNIPLPIVAPKTAAATALATDAEPAAHAVAPGSPLTKVPSDGFAVPARTNNANPRMPVVQNSANVGTHPLALSNVDHRSANVVSAAATATTPAAAPTSIPASTVVTPAPTIAAAGAAAATATPAGPLAPAQIPDAMMRALDKYDALMRSRRGSNGQVDQSL